MKSKPPSFQAPWNVSDRHECKIFMHLAELKRSEVSRPVESSKRMTQVGIGENVRSAKVVQANVRCGTLGTSIKNYRWRPQEDSSSNWGHDHGGPAGFVKNACIIKTLGRRKLGTTRSIHPQVGIWSNRHESLECPQNVLNIYMCRNQLNAITKHVVKICLKTPSH